MEGVDDAIVRFTVNTASLVTSRGLFAVVRAGSRKLKEVKAGSYTNSKGLKKLNKQDQPLDAISDVFAKEDVKVLKRELKKHRIDFAFMPSVEDENKYQLFFKAKDHQTIRYGVDMSLKKIFERQNKQELKHEKRQARDKEINKNHVRKMKPPKQSRGVPKIS